ncbi:MAG: DUF2024 family protein [Bacteroidota bacterium]
MSVAVFDTYVRKANGDTLHFDIIIPDGKYSEQEVLNFGKTYLDSIGESRSVISSKECQFCHIEDPSEEILGAIDKQGYYILDLGEIPAKLPDNPTRRDMILHLRSSREDLRFANFRDYSNTDLEKLLS